MEEARDRRERRILTLDLDEKRKRGRKTAGRGSLMESGHCPFLTVGASCRMAPADPDTLLELVSDEESFGLPLMRWRQILKQIERCIKQTQTSIGTHPARSAGKMRKSLIFSMDSCSLE